MSNWYFSEILGIKLSASKEEIKQAYRRLAKENHPDLYPPEQKAFRELKMITLNEVYSCLMNDFGETNDLRGSHGPKIEREKENTYPARREVGFHKDPSYAYYKQGFISFSKAVHGIAELNDQNARKIASHATEQSFAYSLELLQIAYEYFRRVVEDFPDSIWSHDAQIKLRRIERFNILYRRILSNLKSCSS